MKFNLYTTIKKSMILLILFNIIYNIYAITNYLYARENNPSTLESVNSVDTGTGSALNAGRHLDSGSTTENTSENSCLCEGRKRGRSAFVD